MYDGGHGKFYHHKALTHSIESLDEEFIYLVDDWDSESVRTGTLTAIGELRLKIKYQKNIHSPFYRDKEGWWNGMGIFVLQK